MKSTTRSSRSRSRQVRTAAKVALPWLIACVHAASWADPMRPLLPPNTTAAAPPAASDRAGKARPADSPRETGPGERLVAIRQDSASHWQALFGERWVRAGDRLDESTVAAIDGNSVQLTEGRSRRTLYLLPPLLRAGPADAQAPPGRTPNALIPSTTLSPAGHAALSPPRSNNGLSPP